MRYREDAEECSNHASELLDDDLSKLKDMAIDEWLHRLNLLHLKKFFEKAKIRRVS